MKAAPSASERGHEVILLEKDRVLGGPANPVDLEVRKIDLRNCNIYLISTVMDSDAGRGAGEARSCRGPVDGPARSLDRLPESFPQYSQAAGSSG
jgi:hypothetical protein